MMTLHCGVAQGGSGYGVRNKAGEQTSLLGWQDVVASSWRRLIKLAASVTGEETALTP